MAVSTRSIPSRRWAGPGRLKSPKFFNGWYIIAIGMLGGMLSAGTLQLFLSIMLKPMTAEFGWSRTEASLGLTIGTFSAGLLAPIIGRLADRYGPRALTAIGGLLVALSYFGIFQMTALWQFYLASAVGRGVGAGTMGGIASNTAATNWFRRMRGRALGLITLAPPFGSGLLALIGQAIIDVSCWRTVFLLFSIATAVLLVVPAALVLRRRPEDMGLAPDGDPAPAVVSQTAVAAAATAVPISREERSWTLEQAIRTPTIWLLMASFVANNFGTGAIAFHQVAYFTDQGIPTSLAAIALAVGAFCGAFGNLLWGYLAERFSARSLTIVATFTSATAMVILLLVPSFGGAVVGAALYGVAGRGSASLLLVLLAQYYGRGSYGAISGFSNPFQLIALGVGPLVASMIFDTTGSYHLALILFMVTYLIAAGLVWIARQPTLGRPAASSEVAG